MFAKPRQKKSLLAPPSKKRKTTHAIEEITFDRDARADYLTGFHKRKLARIKHAQDVAEKKAREEKIEMRKQIREDRKRAVEEHVQTVHKLLREAEAAGQGKQAQENEEEEDDEWDGIPDEVPEEPPIDREEEYIDEDRYTTVTIEAVSVDRDGLHKAKVEQEEEEEEEEGDTNNKPAEADAADNKTKEGSKDKPKKKKQKFRYETKFERRITERKQRAKKASR